MGCASSNLKEQTQEFDNIAADVTTSTDRKVSIAMREKRDAQRRGDVFAESIQFDDEYQPNTVPKAEDTMHMIKEALSRNALMSIVSALDIDVMAGFMVSKKFDRGDVVITEGDTGDFFYVVESGTYDVSIAGDVVGTVKTGGSFGELALLYNCPRAATVTTTDSGILWALDRVTFRWIVARNAEDQLDECKKFLRNVPLLHELTDSQMSQLANVVQMLHFKQGERIITKGEKGNVLYIIKTGTVVCSDAGDGVKTVENVRISDGEYFGERALMTREPRAANVTAETDVVAFALDRQAFDEILGSLREVMDRNMSMRVIQSVPILKSLLPSSRASLFAALTTQSFEDGQSVIKEGEPGSTFYIIKSGHAVVSKMSGSTVVEIAKLSVGEFFGEMALLNDEPRKANVVASGSLECFVLERAKFVELLGPLQDILNREAEDRQVELNAREEVLFDDLQVLRTLGTGTFGRVKLVKHKLTGKPYAMKVMQKTQVVAYKQQINILNEKNLLAMCNHPFILKLFQTFKDQQCLYLLMEFVQGGELFAYLHNTERPGGRLPNDHARFYASHVILALEYLHDRNIVYRDLKPENLLIDQEGYIKVVDFGFAKVCADRTYTLCGTPEYLAPELVLGKGHNKGVDYWAYGVLIFEMMVGCSPFVGNNPSDQIQICRNIVKEPLRFPSWIPGACKDIVTKLLDRDVSKRMGCNHGGTHAIRTHPWFHGVEWDKIVKKREPAPWLPALSNPFDASKFAAIDEWDDVAPYQDDGTDWDANF
ncbi:AGC/PKA protein kinase [Aphanomyces invadans]|uniref:cGMP-dependent protein kinase n=1 Tax=Aphanomyces invadans TaxID=157072 RepID=A0A024T9T9_9STRA|nr:AGC/PKA protein kinase [Aphanomyces invadans]ETV90376.1 AGC/PKA protein kinase [Aphanomyces invadans]|eukprot:XP_008880986.1 AGC/PKA protein kinase [Aphanomyces invadans]